MSAAERRAAQRVTAQHWHRFADADVGRMAHVAAEVDAMMAVPTVTAVSPNAGKIASGTPVAIVGTGFVSGATVKFGANSATGVTVNSATSITCTAPAGTLSTTVDVVVTTSGGTSTKNTADQYTYWTSGSGTLPTASDPSAMGNVLRLLLLLYQLTYKGLTASGGVNARLFGKTLDGQDLWDAATNGVSPADMYAKATKAFSMMKLTTGKTPAFMDAAINYGVDSGAISNYNAQGVCVLNSAAIAATLETFALLGGIVGIQNSFLNVPTQYVDQGTLSTGGGNTTVSAINTAGSLNATGITQADWPAGGGKFKIVGQTSPNPTCLQGTYTSRAGTVLSGVVVSGAGATVINNGANIFLAQLKESASGNVLTAAESAGALMLQYDSTAYEKLVQAGGVLGGGNNVVGGCGYTGTTIVNLSTFTVASCTTTNNSTTLTTTGNFLTAGVKPGQPISGTGIPAGALVASMNSSTSLNLNLPATSSATNTMTFTPGTGDMPITKGMYVSNAANPTDIAAGTTVASVNSNGTQITLSHATAVTRNGQVLTFTLGQSTDYVAALAVDANANLNAMLDQLIILFGELATLAIPVIFRHMSESNIAGNWYGFTGSANCYFWPYLFAYCHGYMTNNQWFVGQPTSATPVHNLLFVWAPYASSSAPITLPPTINGKCFDDAYGIDEYANPPSDFTTDLGLNGMQGLLGRGAGPHAYTEVFGGVNTNAANQFPQGYCDAATYGAGNVDLSTATQLVLDLLPDWPTGDGPPAQPFASGSTSGTSTGTSSSTLTNTGATWTANAYAGFRVYVGTNFATVASNTATVLTLTSAGWSAGTPASVSAYSVLPVVYVPTVNGLIAATYTGGGGSAAPVTLTGLVPRGAATGSYIQSKGCASQPVAITSNNCGTSAFLTAVKNNASWFMLWWGQFDQTYADLAGTTTIITDSTMITLENLSSFFNPLWAISAADAAATVDAATRTLSFARSGSDACAAGDSGTRSVGLSRSGADLCAAGDAGSRSGAHSRSGTDAAGTADAGTRTGTHARSGSDAAVTADSGRRAVSLARTGVDPCAAGDSGSRAGAWSRSGADGAVTGDVGSRAAALLAAGFDACTVVDMATRSVVLSRSGSDAAVTADSGSASGVHSRSGTDAATTGDGAGANVSLARTGADGCRADDSGSRTQARSLSGADACHADDLGTRRGAPAGADRCAAVDVPNALAAWSRSGTDLVGTADAATRSGTHSRSGTDPCAASDVGRSATVVLRSGADACAAVDAGRATTSASRHASDLCVTVDAGKIPGHGGAFDLCVTVDQAVVILPVAPGNFDLVAGPVTQRWSARLGEGRYDGGPVVSRWGAAAPSRR